MENVVHTEDLEHSGIKGMKWGIRRYQNKDGTLTPAGKKRYRKELEKLKNEQKILKNKQATKAKLDKLESMKKEINEQKKSLSSKGKNSGDDGDNATVDNRPKKKTVSDLSDDELRIIVNRLDLERRYSDLTPKQVSKGKSFVSDMLTKAVVPGVQEATKSIIKDAIVNAVKKNVKDKNK